MADPSDATTDAWSRDVFASMAGGIFRTSPEGRLLSANESMARLLGYGSIQEALATIGSTTLDVWVNPAERARHVQRLIREGQVRADEVRFKRKDGSILWVALTTRAVPDAAGGLDHIEGYFEDISERRAAADALREATRLNQQIIDSAQDGIIVYGPDLRYQVWSPFMETLTGQRALDVLGKHPLEVFPFLAEVGVVAMLERLLAGGPSERHELPRNMAGGVDPGWVSNLSAPLRNADGAVVGVIAIVRDVTAEKEASERLLESEQRFRALFDRAPVALCEADFSEAKAYLDSLAPVAGDDLDGYFAQHPGLVQELAGRIRMSDANLATLTLFDAAHKAEFLTRWRELVIGASVTATVDTVVAAYRRKVAVSHELVLRTFHRRRLAVQLEVTVVSSADGPWSRVLISVVNITERKRAEEALRKSESKFAGMFRSSPAAISVTDLSNGNRAYDVNAAFEKLSGYSRAEVIGKTFDEVGIWVDAAEHELLRKLVKEKGRVDGFECSFRRKDGEIRIGVMSAEPLEIDGRPCVVTATLDLTERRRAEEAARESESRFTELMRNLPAAAFIKSSTGETLFVNHFLEQFPGFQDWRGKTTPQLVAGDAGSHMTDDDRRALEEGVVRVEERLTDAQGVEHVFETVKFPIRVPGKPPLLAGVAVDVTVHKRMQEELRQSQKMEAIGQLAGGIAHDFNNILASIMLNVGLAETEAGLPVHIRQTLSEVQTEANRAANLTRQLLQFSRRTVLEPKLVDANEVVENLLKMLGRLIGENIHLDFTRSAAPALARVDVGMLEQVLMNLAVNARDAMPRGGKLGLAVDEVPLERAVPGSGAEPGRFVRITVTDTGHGMDEETRKHIFEPFFTTKEAGRGTGLGLATVYGIVAQHRGWLEVDSVVERGTSFRVYLPAAQGAEAAVPSPRPVTLSGTTPGSRTILLVEDAPSLRLKVAQGLRLLGYRVLEAADGKEALGRWQEHKNAIDLLFTDMVMPEGLSGFDLVETFRRTKPGLAVVVSSGYSAELAGAGRAAARGIVYLKKPYDLDTLARTIEDTLAHR